MKRGVLKKTGKLKSNVALRTTKPLKSVTRRITGVSKQVAEFNEEFEDQKPMVARRCKGLCEARLDGCWTYYSSVHHTIGRGPKGSNDLKYLLAVCAPCHRWIHDNPKDPLVKEKGWLQ